MKKRVLVLGLGNEILRDDGVGIVALRLVRERFRRKRVPVEFIETNEMGLSLLDFLEGYEHAIIIDSIMTEKYEPGTIMMFDKETFDNPAAGNPHHMGLDEIFDLAEKVKIKVPKMFDVIAIEVEDPYSFGEELTPKVKRAIPKVVTKIERLIEKAMEEK